MKIDLREIPVFYINLDNAEIKKERTENLLNSLNFKQITRISAIKHPLGRIVGCARSHHKILCENKPPFIILEDDCTLNKEFDGVINIPETADAVYLGFSHWGRYLNHSGPFVHSYKISPECVRVFNMLATHSILYLDEEYAKICSRIARHYGYEIQNHLDIGFAEIQKLFNVIALDEPIFRQYEWSAITAGKLSENSIDITQSENFFKQVITDDSNFYKLNDEFKSPFRQLINKRDVNGVPGYFLPTRII
jgi:hypothetical protein